MKKHIIVRGGGVPNPLKMFQYIFAQTQAKTPKVLYLGTAGGESDAYKVITFEAILKAGGTPKSLNLFLPVPDVNEALSDCDVVWVGGGNTRSEMILWRAWGLDIALRNAYERGVVLTGLSAGGICWFNQGTTDSWAGPLRAFNEGLGFLPFSHCPHYDGEALRRPTYHNMVASGELSNGYAVDDAAAAHFIDGQLAHVVTLQDGKTAYWVDKDGNGVKETALPAQLL